MIELDKVENCDMPLPGLFGQQYGWICPVCGKGLAPWVRECSCAKSNSVATNKSVDDITNEFYYTRPINNDDLADLNNFKPTPGYSESDYRNNQIIHNVDVNSDEFKGAFSGRFA